MSHETITCVIIEDDEVSISVVSRLIEKTPFLKLERAFTQPVEALNYLSQNEVDVVFLDIEMPEMSGFDLLQSLRKRPAIIVMTSNDQYAVKAFDYAVDDFLVKPVTDYPRFLKAVTKVLDLRKEQPVADTFFVKADSLLHNVGTDNLLYIEAFGDYVKIHLVDKVLMVLSTLKALESRLPSSQFVRVHRSYIVNIKKIKSIDSRNILIGENEIPLAPNYREDLLSKIELL